MGLLFSVVWLHGCGSSTPPTLDRVPPHTLAAPAGGIYRTFPPAITLTSEAGAIIYYRWEGGSEQRYTAPLQIPESGPQPRTLHFWAEDDAGNRGPRRREHYLHAPEAPEVSILDLDRSVLGKNDFATLRWRSAETNATYELAVTSGDWGEGKRLAQGSVTPGLVQQTTIAASALFPGENRLWLRVKPLTGAVAATSRLLTLHATPASTRSWPPGGAYGTAQAVALITERPATVYYTIDGSEPTLASPRYTQPLTLAQSTTLRFFSVDAYGNREATQQEHFAIQPQAATISLLTLISHGVGSDAPLLLSWRSNKDGRYDVTLQSQQEARQVTVQQGVVQRQQEMQTVIAQHFLTPGDWRVQLRVQPSEGQPGGVAFMVHAYHRETFATTHYRNSETTTATWDTTQQQLRLSRGPHLLSTYRTRARSQQVTVHGAYAYLANGKGGLHILEVSDPYQPRRIGMFYPHGKAVALAKHDRYVYMAASGSGITIIDVTQPQAPTLVATLPLPGSVSDITIAVPFAYVGTQQGTLTIVDLTTPLQPQRLSAVEIGGSIVDIAVDAGIVYLACLDQGVVMVDARIPQQPRILQRWSTSGAATGIAVHAQQIFVAAGALDVLDVAHPDAPARTYRQVQSAYGVALLPPHAVVAAGIDGVQLLSMDGHGSLIPLRNAHYAARVALRGSLALIADTRGGLRIFDLAQAALPRLLAALEDIGTIVDVVIDGSLAYLANDDQGSGLVIVDVSDPTAPRVMGQYHSESTTDVAIWKNFALLSDAAGLLHVVDVRQPAAPQLRGSLALPGTAHRLVLAPPYGLVAGDAAGVHLIEMTAAGQPHLHSTLPIPGRALDIALVEDTAYIAAVDGGIQVVHIDTPARPTLGTPYHHTDGKGDHIIRLIAHQNRLYAIDSQRGVQILEPSMEGAWQVHGSVTVPQGAPWGLTAVGPYLFVTTLLHSLYVMDLSIPSQPRFLSTVPYGGSAITASDGILYIAVRGRQGAPGGLHLLEAFAVIPDDVWRPLQMRGVVALPGPTPGSRLVNRVHIFHTPGIVESTGLSAPDVLVPSARLRVQDFWSASGHIHYALSNDGGAHWYPVQPGTWYHFATAGTELRWRAVLESTEVLASPHIDTLRIDYPAPHKTPE